jgi:uncharacterized delta-60 repeat protein
MPRLALILTACAALLAATAVPASAAEPGDFDRSFGDQGRLAINPGGLNFEVIDAATDAQGRIVVAGGSQGDMAVARLLPDGTLDSSFDGDGVKVIESGPTMGGERARSVAIDPASGAILIFGDASVGTSPTNQDLAVARLTSTGALDASFDGPAGNGNGVFRLSFDALENAGEVVAGDSGKVILGAMVGGNQAGNNVRVVQLNQNGSLDTAGFGAPNGYADVQYTPSSGSFIEGMARQSDGKIVVSGSINGTATFAVARVTADGELDTAFNSAGAVPGVARPPLPPGHISSRAFDIEVVSDGVVVAGELRAGSEGGFDTDPMLAKLTFGGTPDSSFGGGSGFRKVPAGAGGDISVFSSLELLADGTLLASGTLGPIASRDQILARFSASGAHDAGFAGTPDGLIRSDEPLSESGLALGTSGGVAYMVGQGFDGGTTHIAVTAVCAEVPPGCPSPDAPVSLQVDPASGGDENNPAISGELAAGPAATSVSIYADAACSGEAAATGTAAQFAGEGIPVSVPDNSTTTFYATATGPNGTSACSTASVTYTETTPPPAPPVSLQIDPASGADQNNPAISGELADGPAADTVSIYADPACSGEAAATGTAAQFAGEGIAVSVPDNSTTTFYATATNGGGTSACSTASVTYAEITPPAAEEPPPNVRPDAKVVGPTGQRAAALKKCAKVKQKAKKRKCKKRARKLPV